MRSRLAAAWFACFALLAALVAGSLFLLDASLDERQREHLRGALSESGGALALIGFVLFAAAGLIANWFTAAYLARARRLADSARLMAWGNPRYRVEAEGPRELRELAEAINALASRHEAALNDVETRVAQARLDLERQRNRLAALMSELTQSVVVCNAQGEVLLYNERARALLSPGTQTARASGYLGLGRSLYSLVERDPVLHALDELRHRLAAGETGPVVSFALPAHDGRLLRAELAPVAAPAEAGDAGAPEGFVLLLEDVSEAASRVETRDRVLLQYTQQARSALASLRAAAENLASHPDMDRARRDRFVAIVCEETTRLSAALESGAGRYVEDPVKPWLPARVPVADLAETLRRHIENRVGVPVRVTRENGASWVNVDSHRLTQGVVFLAQRIKAEAAAREIELRAAVSGGFAHLVLAWNGERLAPPAVAAWEQAILPDGGAGTLREIVERHRGDAWYEFDAAGRRSRYRLLLPLVEPEPGPVAAPGGRPQYYDFDLLRRPSTPSALDQRALAELDYTVFDTETTGLDPSAGDEIISIGAARIVNGRLLAGERFEQLVDPRRPLHPDSIRIHGIRPEALRGKPTIEAVLPAFHRFCEDTVLVGHNVAFDLRFLELKEAATGVRFTQPVLDTLLLSACLHGDLESHELEAIAGRLGVSTAGRHTAMGDALMTGEIFLRMIPMLARRGIVTLGQARAACARTLHARLGY
jgi:DNA polymerase-3 subunit epsilon